MNPTLTGVLFMCLFASFSPVGSGHIRNEVIIAQVYELGSL